MLDPAALNPPLNPHLIVDGAGLDKVRSFISKKLDACAPDYVPVIGLDTETNVEDVFTRRYLRTIQIGDRNEQYVIDLLAFCEGGEGLLRQHQGHHIDKKYHGPGHRLKPVIDVVSPILESGYVTKVGHSLEFEYHMLKLRLGLRIWNLYCTLIAEKVIKAGLEHFKQHGYWGLDPTFGRYYGYKIDKSQQTSFDLRTPLTEKQVIYGALDLRLPLSIRSKQLKQLVEDKLVPTAQIEFDAIGSFQDIHLNGMLCSKQKWGARVDEIEAKHKENLKKLDSFFLPIVGPKQVPKHDLDALENKWRDLAVTSPEEKLAKSPFREAIKAERCKARDEAKAAFYDARRAVKNAQEIIADCEGEALINYDSNKQLKEAMYQMKGFNKTNLPDTNDGTLKKLANSKPVCAALRDFRTTQKILSTYGRAWITEFKTKPSNDEGWVNPDTGRIHPEINQLEAETGRTSESNPNGQNLPNDKEVRACFVADDLDESIRISTCCDSETEWEPLADYYRCKKCQRTYNYELTKPEEYVLATVDMSGAELRIIADYGNVTSWINAFNKNWDVHSVSTEILYPEKWPIIGEPGCAYFTKDHQKCKCPEHQKLRNGTKATNFLLCYGGGPSALAEALGCTVDEAAELMGIHEQKFPDVWRFLDQSGKEALMKCEARSMYGRRRAFKRPTWEMATKRANEDAQKKWKRDANEREIRKAFTGLGKSIERQGKNHKIQGTNADIIKRAMGAGYDINGKPYLWHVLEPKYKAKIINMVHDELLVLCPKRFGEEVMHVIGDAYKRAAAEVMKKVMMDYEGKVEAFWCK